MKPLFVLPLLLACAIAGARDEAAAEWDSLNLRLESLGTWGTRHYTYSLRKPGGEGFETLGTISLATRVTGDSLVLHDVYELKMRGAKLRLELTQTCRRDCFLTPVRIESRGEGDDEFGNFVATVADGMATIRPQDRGDRTKRIPPGTITDAAMMRLVTLVPRTPGKTYSYGHSLETSELNLKENYRLTVLEPESIVIAGRAVKCAKFRLAGGGIRPVFYWVGEDGVLQRLMLDDRKIIELKVEA